MMLTGDFEMVVDGKAAAAAVEATWRKINVTGYGMRLSGPGAACCHGYML